MGLLNWVLSAAVLLEVDGDFSNGAVGDHGTSTIGFCYNYNYDELPLLFFSP